jgi:hypothetical protein
MKKRARMAASTASFTDGEYPEEEEEAVEEGSRSGYMDGRRPCWVVGKAWEGSLEEGEEADAGTLMNVVSQLHKSGSHEDLVHFVCGVNQKMEGGAENAGASTGRGLLR